MNHNPLYIELLEQLQTGWAGLPDKPEETPELTLKALWMFAGAEPLSIQRVAENHLVLPETVDTALLRRLVQQRLEGVPLAYLTGRQSFMGIEMLSSPQAMIPRKETEILGRAALETLRETAGQQSCVQVADICTGSGNMALALAAQVPNCRVRGVDISPEAVHLARRNAAFLGLQERVDFQQGDLFGPLDTPELHGQLDLVTCNPPYISSRRVDVLPREISSFEPRPAFDGGPFGITIMTRLIRDALCCLRPGGRLVFEVGLGQGEAMLRIMEKTGAYTGVRTFTDQAGVVRVLSAVKQ